LVGDVWSEEVRPFLNVKIAGEARAGIVDQVLRPQGVASDAHFTAGGRGEFEIALAFYKTRGSHMTGCFDTGRFLARSNVDHVTGCGGADDKTSSVGSE
jgi:hypothetical protein